MGAEQKKDIYLSQLLQWIRENSRPTTEQVSTLEYEEKLLWARLEELFIVNGLLCLADSQG